MIFLIRTSVCWISASIGWKSEHDRRGPGWGLVLFELRGWEGSWQGGGPLSMGGQAKDGPGSFLGPGGS